MFGVIGRPPSFFTKPAPRLSSSTMTRLSGFSRLTLATCRCSVGNSSEVKSASGTPMPARTRRTISVLGMSPYIRLDRASFFRLYAAVSTEYAELATRLLTIASLQNENVARFAGRC